MKHFLFRLSTSALPLLMWAIATERVAYAQIAANNRPTQAKMLESRQIQRAQKASDDLKRLIKEEAPWPLIIAEAERALQYWRETGDIKRVLRQQGDILTLHYIRGDYAKARELAEIYINSLRAKENSIYDSELEYLLVAAMGIAVEQGDFIGANQTANTLIDMKRKGGPQKGPDAYKYFISIARNYGLAGDYKQAKVVLREAGKTNPEDSPASAVEIGLAEAEILLLNGHMNLALAKLNTIQTLYPKEHKSRTLSDSTTAFALQMLNSLYSCPKTIARAHTEMTNSLHPAVARDNPGSPKAEIFLTTKQKIANAERRLDFRAHANYLRDLAMEKMLAGDRTGELRLQQQELEIRRRINDWDDQGRVLSDIAEHYLALGEPQKAIDNLVMSTEIAKRLKKKGMLARLNQRLGDLYFSLSQPQSAELFYKATIEIAADSENIQDESLGYRLLGFAQRDQGQFRLAIQSVKKSLELTKKAGDCASQALSEAILADINIAFGDLTTASQHAEHSIRLSDQLTRSDIRAFALSNALRAKSAVLMKEGKSSEALRQSRDALRVAQETNFHQAHQGRIYTLVAESSIALGLLPEAIDAYEQRLALAEKLDLDPERAQSLFGIAQLQKRMGDRAAALGSINKAIAIIERMRKQVVDPELRTSFFASKQDIFSFKIDLLLEWEQLQRGAGHAAEAFHTSERSRSRTLLELLDNARADIRQGIVPELLEEEKTLQYRRTTLDKRFQQAFSEKGDPSLLPQLQQERQQLLQQMQDLRQAIRARSPRYAALTDPEPLHLAQVQQELLDSDTLLLHYALGKERSYLFVVSRDDMQVIPLPAAAEITSLVEALRTPLTLNQNLKQIEQRAAALSQQVLAPARKAIGRHRRVIVVPDGPLHLVPFTALPLNPGSENGLTLGEEHPLLYLPSSSTLALIRQQKERGVSDRPASLAILADPVFSARDPRLLVAPSDASSRTSQATSKRRISTDLKALSFLRASASLEDCDNQLLFCRLGFTRTEAQSIAALLPANRVALAMDFAADLQRATSAELGRYSLVHFATHGLFNGQQPALSGLLLSRVDRSGSAKDGFLQLGDIFNLKLNADLVVLSACETGLGAQVQGEGLVGITRGFLYAGTPRVVVSLWQVSDQATSSFMTSFYKGMLQQKLSASQALQAAQKELRANPLWISPYYWAAFALQGDW